MMFFLSKSVTKKWRLRGLASVNDIGQNRNAVDNPQSNRNRHQRRQNETDQTAKSLGHFRYLQIG
jgi:hypothetical protein